MRWQVEICPKPDQPDLDARRVRAEVRELGITSVRQVHSARGYLLEGDLDQAQAMRIATELLVNPVVEDGMVVGPDEPLMVPEADWLVQVLKKPGVMDPVEASVIQGVADMGLAASAVKTYRKYLFHGDLTDAQKETITGKVLANDSIEQVLPGEQKLTQLPAGKAYTFELGTVTLAGLDEEAMVRLSREAGLSLDGQEMLTIQAHYADLGRDPTDIELETIAQTWSEHCSHKTLMGRVEWGGTVIENLLASTIARVTRELDKPWCISVFEDNAGIIAFDEAHAICFKVETHNHPSAIEPYGGANTGIGGVIRDPMGTGLGAKPVANTDIFCFAPPDLPPEKLPKGVLHPKRVMKGVVAGVRDYGNRMGIPTINGAVLFDERYLGNPLVYCGNIGLIPNDKCFKEPRPGDRVLAVGGRTGRDGIHGATFSSVELHEQSETLDSGAVQIGNAITEKKVLDTLLVARDRGLYSAITDCGAGGFSSAVGEMGEKIGAEVDLETAPLKYDGLSYTEIWISEAQERMVLAVPPEHLDEIMTIFTDEDVEATVIGRFTDTGRLVLRYESQVVGDMDMGFLHNGRPQVTRKATWEPPERPELQLPPEADFGDSLKRILGAWNVCSKEWVVRQYDHEVQGGSVVKPLVGIENDGPGDASVFRPVLDSRKAVAVANGINPRYGDIDPYHMAASAIDEAVRNLVCVGTRPDRIAVLDNFCWGNTNRPETLGTLVRAAQACYDVGHAYGTPFISGKDSLNNEYATEAGTIVIPPTLLISGIGIVDDVSHVVTMDLKQPGNFIYVVGLTRNELGGSHYTGLFDQTGGQVPTVNVSLGRRILEGMHQAIREGTVRACHDCSEGGLAVAVAEMAFAGGLGASIDLEDVPATKDAKSDVVLLFSESNTRFVVEVEPAKAKAFEAAVGEVPRARIGDVTDTGRVTVLGLSEETVLDESLADLKAAWQAPLRDV